MTTFKTAIIFALASLALQQAAGAQTVPTGFQILPAAPSLDGDAVGFALLPDGRILVVNQFSGTVKLVVNGVLRPSPLVTVPGLQTSSEKGLLGIAVDPDFPLEPFIYVFHSHVSFTNRVSRFTVGGDLTDPNSSNLTIDVASQLTLVDDMPAQAFNHNGGTLRFGSDKTLYISHGDDANRSLVQNLTTLNGKILRLNRDGSIPDDNPVFPNEPPNARPEIFAFGFRNPFRFALDPLSDRLFIGDVGENTREEFDLSTGGENFGWPRYEGTFILDPNAPLIAPTPVFPIWEYAHGAGPHAGVALATYRQADFPDDASFPNNFEGAHFYAEFYDDWVRYVIGSGPFVTSIDFGAGFINPTDGALGPDGALYILEYGQTLNKIVYNGSFVRATPQCPSNFASGCTISVPVVVDVSSTSPPQALGSYMASLMWNPSLLAYAGFTAGAPPFDNPTVNEANVTNGVLFFNESDPVGASGTVTIINVEFEVVGQAGQSGSLNLAFTQMAAAGTQSNFLPILAAEDCNNFVIAATCHIGDVTLDNAPTIFDGLIIATFSVGLEIPPEFAAQIAQGCGDATQDQDTTIFDSLVIATFAVGLPVEPFPVGEPLCL